MVGAVITDAKARRPDLRFPLPPEFERRLKGARVLSLRRRAKYLLCELSTGETLIMHLGMSGRFTVKGDGRGRFHKDYRADPRHDHVSLVVSGPMGTATIDYNDPRRFGFMDLAPTAKLATSPIFLASAPSRWARNLRPKCWRRPSRARPRRQNRRSSINGSSPASAISMSVRRCSGPASHRAAKREP